MKCPVCKDDIKAWDVEGPKTHLIGTMDKTGHIHTHGDLDDEKTKEIVQDLALATGTILHKANELSKKEYVFHNRQRIGDILMFTCAIRDFKRQYPDVRVNVQSTAAHIWDNNPFIDRTLELPKDQVIKIGPSKGTNQSNRIDWHFANAYRLSIEDALGIHIQQGESYPDIYLTQEEYDAPRIDKDPYWLITLTGEKSWGCKMYPFERWQDFVVQNKNIKFYQLGALEDNPPRLQGDNVVDYVGKTQSKETGIRDLFKLFLNAEGSVGLVSFQMHLMGAFPGKPCVVIAGAREPVSFTQYAGHRYLSTDGALPCGYPACWHCDIKECEAVVNGIPKCVDLIKPDDITRALKMYYEGGVLEYGKVSTKFKFKNIVKTPVKVPVPAKTYDPALFGPGTITEKDWEFLESIINKYQPKTILEFGSGLSTYLMSKKAKVTAYETDKTWLARAKEKYGDLDIRLWDGKILDTEDKFDLAFVDGPSGGNNREPATKLAGELANIVVTHDGWAKEDKEWQKRHLAPKFKATRGEGTRSMDLWLADETTMPVLPTPEAPGRTNVCPNKKYIKFVSTARGWGGCARSITTIMKFLLKAGHKVEFIPFRNKVTSREFNEYINTYLNGLIITENYDTLKDPCDTLFVYADDYVWEFNQPLMIDTFSGLKANKKVMMLNYRRGGVGEIDWTKGWDKYMFLNSTQEKELLSVLPGVKTKVLPPCTELEEFFKVKPEYNTSLRIVRHNSQGDTKFDRNIGTLINEILDFNPTTTIHMMPGPSFFVEGTGRFKKYRKNEPPIPEFLGLGNLFWYSLPEGYQDMGPRVILEAMAAGLPVLADNWGGAPDRVTPECGWICDNTREQLIIIKHQSPHELEEKGKAARQRAKDEFIPEKWVSEIL